MHFEYILNTLYGGVKNCNAIRDDRRRAIIDTKSNATTGFDARAKMLRFHEEHLRTFYGILRTRNNVKERILLHE